MLSNNLCMSFVEIKTGEKERKKGGRKSKEEVGLK